MSEQSIPSIACHGTRPRVTRKVLANIAVAHLQRSIRFFEALAFTVKRQLNESSAACMLVGGDVQFMLLSTRRFEQLTDRPLAQGRRSKNAIYALSVESRAAVRSTVNRALEHGATATTEPQDHGVLFGGSSQDPDGRHCNVIWMDPALFSANSILGIAKETFERHGTRDACFA